VFDVEAGKYGCCPAPAKPLWDNQTKSGQNNLPPSKDRWKIRSTTYKGIATAMAEQWGSQIINDHTNGFAGGSVGKKTIQNGLLFN